MTFCVIPYLQTAAAVGLPFSYFTMLAPADKWPLPGQVAPALTPCAFCRRRLHIGGKPVFKSCSCKAFGPPVTIAALVAGAVLAAGVGAWWLARRRW